MNFKFSAKSREELGSCHPDLQEIAYELIKEMDVMILCGHRGQREQDSAFNNGKSRLRWPKSNHNTTPSRAMDVAPCPLDWNDIARFNEMLDKIEEIADRLKIRIRLGRDFSFKDYPHVELHDKNKA